MVLKGVGESGVTGNKNYSFELESPELAIGEELQIAITVSGNPMLFHFHPTKYDSERLYLQADMAHFYDDEENEELKVSKVVENKPYACKEGDSSWYRVVVTTVLECCNNVLVKYCDYGDFSIAPITSLRELVPEFKELPFTAIEGQLEGVAPVDDEWSQEANLRFQELTRNIILTAKVIGFIENPTSPMKRVAILSLNDEGIDVADQLVMEEHAIKID